MSNGLREFSQFMMQPIKALSDSELLLLLKERNHAAFTEIYHRYWAVLFRHSSRMLKDEEQASDVIQDIFTMLWNRTPDITVTSLPAYLFASVRNKTIDILNRGKLKDRAIQSLSSYMATASRDLQEDLIMKDLAERIEKGIEKLPPKMRAIFEMSRKQHLAHKEIAEQLQVTEGNVTKTISRAIKILRMRVELIIIGILLLVSQ